MKLFFLFFALWFTARLKTSVEDFFFLSSFFSLLSAAAIPRKHPWFKRISTHSSCDFDTLPLNWRDIGPIKLGVCFPLESAQLVMSVRPHKMQLVCSERLRAPPPSTAQCLNTPSGWVLIMCHSLPLRGCFFFKGQDASSWCQKTQHYCGVIIFLFNSKALLSTIWVCSLINYTCEQ